MEECESISVLVNMDLSVHCIGEGDRRAPDPDCWNEEPLMKELEDNSHQNGRGDSDIYTKTMRECSYDERSRIQIYPTSQEVLEKYIQKILYIPPTKSTISSASSCSTVILMANKFRHGERLAKLREGYAMDDEDYDDSTELKMQSKMSAFLDSYIKLWSFVIPDINSNDFHITFSRWQKEKESNQRITTATSKEGKNLFSKFQKPSKEEEAEGNHWTQVNYLVNEWMRKNDKKIKTHLK